MNTMSATKKLVLSAIFLAIGLLLPLLTGQIPEIGKMLLPMHIPVLLCGFICSWKYGAGMGFILPLVRSLIFGMPPIYPTALAMAFELAAYGFLAGFLYAKLPKKIPYIYVSLIGAMLGGRLIWGAATAILLGIGGSSFGFAAFWAGGFATAVPGIIVQIVLIPIIIIALQKSKLLKGE